MSLYDMHENARRCDKREGSKTRRVAKTNAKVRRMVRRKKRLQGKKAFREETDE